MLASHFRRWERKLNVENVRDEKQLIVEFRAVQKSYDGETLAIKNLNLAIQRSEFLTLLGPSGSGKTTCLMMLAGFEPVTNGEIVLDGRPITHLPPHKRNIGVVFQNYALFPHRTVARNVSYPLECRRVPKAEIKDRVAKAVELVRLSGYEGRLPRQLSGGQQQRVAIARALVFEPKLLLMDEPLGALDRQLREQMQYEIRRLHERLDISIVYVTHDQSEALIMSDRIAVINGGVIEQLASPTELYDEPRNAFVAQFIGENNTFVGEVIEIREGICTARLQTGETVRAIAVNCGAKGALTTLSIRPESVALAPPERFANKFKAEVQEIIFHGDHIRLRLTVCGNREFIVKLPKGLIGSTDLQVGGRTAIGWDSTDCRALDRSRA